MAGAGWRSNGSAVALFVLAAAAAGAGVVAADLGLVTFDRLAQAASPATGVGLTIEDVKGTLFVLITGTLVYVLVALAGIAAKEAGWFETEEAQSAGLSQILNDITGTTIWCTVLAAGAVISIST